MNKTELTILIPGHEIKDQIGTRIDLGEFDAVTAEVVGAYELEQSRAASSEFVKHETSVGEIVELELQDGITLYLSTDSYLDLTKKAAQRNGSEPIRAPLSLDLDDPSRGFKDFFVKSLRFLKLLSPADDLADKTAGKIAQKIENQLPYGPGLYRCKQEQFDLVEITQAISTRQPILVFIHGTASSTEGSFGALWNGEQNTLWRDYTENAYGEQIYAFEHRSLSESPIDNAIQLLEALPQGAKLHLVSHSRGGLVGELLCRGQITSGSPINDDMLRLFEPKPGASQERRQAIKQQHDALILLNELLQRKKIEIERFVRVACPARGTTLASGRLDLYFSVVLNALGLIPGLRLSSSYRFVKAFLLAVAKERTQPEDLPGLEAMMPTSRLIQLINWPSLKSKADLSVIAGDVEGGGLFHSLAVLATDLFYLNEHDLVVNSNAMVGDAPRENGIRRSFHQGSEVNHFSYFKNVESVRKLISGLARTDGSEGGYKLVSPVGRAGKRGDNKTYLDETAPIVYLLPGLCGSQLHSGETPVWIDLMNIAAGRFTELDIQHANVKAAGLHEDTYGGLLDYLGESHRVIPFATDWRRSLFDSAKALASDIRKQLLNTQNNPVPIRLLAHSQGGLIARAMIAEAPDVWEALLKREGSRLIMLGTPNRGSFSVARLLLGHDRFARLLALLDFKHDLKSVLKVFVHFPGILEMLPAVSAENDIDLFSINSWKRLQQTSPDNYVIPDENVLASAKKNRQRLDSQLQGDGSIISEKNICYVAGQGSATPDGISLVESQKGLEIKFNFTAQGDGRVTWASGRLTKEKTWYAESKHGDLTAKTELFPALQDLLETGQTFRLPQKQPSFSRSGITSLSRGMDEILLYPDVQDLSEAASLSSGASVTAGNERTQLRVQITHGDLQYANYPVAVGHYQDDLIISAEEALNQVVEGRLSKSYQLGLYPGRILTAKSFLKPAASTHEHFSGAIVIGLGHRGTLSAALLQSSVTHALLDFVRTVDEQQLNEQRPLGVSFLLVSTGIGGLTLGDALSAILRGVTQTNDTLNIHKFNSLRIKEIEVVEIYLDRAVRAMRALRRICGNEEFESHVRLKPFIQNGTDGRERIPHHRSRSVWQRLQIASEEDGALRYTYLTEHARADATLVQTQRRLIDSFIEQAISTSGSDKGLTTCLFELLVPNDFKHNAPHQDDSLLILDEDTARYPWEMLQQKLDRETLPLAVRAGMIRQLVMDKYNSRPLGVFRGPNNALVIGDPITGMDKFPQLPGARQEAYAVTEKLAQEGEFNVETRIESRAGDIIKALYAKPYRVLHLAGHGAYQYHHEAANVNEKITGMVLSHGIFLTPAEVKQMSTIPELVFINCCYLGYIENRQTRKFSTDLKPHLLAANLATQFIKEGVRCVIAAGWEVHDSAAKVFAQVFYEKMLAPNNATFGDAVQAARKKVYEQFPGINTWGAYQCYGDPHFRFNPEIESKAAEESVRAWRQNNIPDFSAPKELMLKLRDLAKEAATSSKHENKRTLKDEKKRSPTQQLQQLVNQIPQDWFQDGALHSAIAAVWSALGEQDKAVDRYEKAMTADTANLSFETVEKFGETKVKHVSTKLDDNEIKDEEPIAVLEATIEQLQHLNAIACSKKREDLLYLTNKNISRTYNHLGHGFKQQAMVSTKEHRLRAINRMIHFYKKAFDHSKNSLGVVDIHALLQWQIATVVKNWRSSKNELEDSDKWLKEARQSIAKQQTTAGKLQLSVNRADCELVAALASDSISKTKNNLKKNIDMIAGKYTDALILAKTNKLENVLESVQFLLVLSYKRRTKTAQIAQENLVLLQKKLDARVGSDG